MILLLTRSATDFAATLALAHEELLFRVVDDDNISAGWALFEPLDLGFLDLVVVRRTASARALTAEAEEQSHLPLSPGRCGATAYTSWQAGSA